MLRRNNGRLLEQGEPMPPCDGLGGSPHTWRYLTTALAARHWLKLPDRGGSGEPRIDAYAFANYATPAGYAPDIGRIGQAVVAGQSVENTSARLAPAESLTGRLPARGPAKSAEDSSYQKASFILK